MVFAAGLGTRMRPITEHTPKALVKLGGKTLLDYALDSFEAAGCERIVVNLHHLGDLIRDHLRARPRGGAEICLSDESPQLLETGGGVVKALPLLGDAPFFCANSDTVWFDGPASALDRLADEYAAHDETDALLLLHRKTQAVGYRGQGDFALNGEGRLFRGAERPFVFTGLQVLHPRLLRGRTAEPFSLRELYLAAERASTDGHLERMRGLIHAGDWVHVGSPADLADAERFVQARSEAGAKTESTG